MIKNFNNDILNYDLEKYNFPKWALNRIWNLYPDIESLETIHFHVPINKLGALQKYVSDGCETPEFMEMLDNFLTEYITPLVDGKEFLIQRFGTLRVVIPNQVKAGRILNYHQGIFVGNGTGLRTIWTPFTKTWGNNSMHMLDYDTSVDITRRSINEKWSQEYLNDYSESKSHHIKLDPGQSWLFNQELIHGNVNNDTGITRVSMDLRIMIKGENYGRKYPGQYFRIPFDWKLDRTKDSIDNTQSFVSYVGWNSQYSKHLPMILQRSFMDKYLKKHDIKINDYHQENEYLDHQPNLQYLLGTVKNVVMLSIYCLPDKVEDRHKIYEVALSNKCLLHFAQEDIIINNQDDIDLIEKYLNWGTSYLDWRINV